MLDVRAEITTEKTCIARIWGDMELISPDGADLLPKGAKDRAILATLLVAPDMRRSRRWLQGLLWGEKTNEKSAANLRQSVSRLRKQFADTNGVLRCDRHSIWLDTNRIQIEERDTGQSTLFEGLDLREEAFEDWLRDIRADFAPDAQGGGAFFREGAPNVRRLKPVVTLVMGRTVSSPFDKDLLRVTTALRNRLLFLEVIDLREADEQSGFCHGLVIRVFRNPAGQISTRIETGEEGDALWSTTFQDRGDISECTGLLADSTVEALMGLASRDGIAPIESLDALSGVRKILDGLFIPGRHSADELMTEVDALFEVGPSAMHFALRNCVQMLRFGERMPGHEALKQDQILSDLNDSLVLNPGNAFVHALAAHTHSLFLHDPEAAIAHGKLATSISPDSSLSQTLYALAHLRAGNAQTALGLSARALLTGRFSRYRAFLDAVHSAAAACNGRFDMARDYAKRSKQSAPNFSAAQKLLFLAYARTGELDQAAQISEQIRSTEPDFGKKWVLQTPTSVNIELMRPIMAESAQLVGL